MSRTKPLPTVSANPSRRFIGVRSGSEQGWFDYWEKFESEQIVKQDDGTSKKQKGQNVKVDFSTKGFALLEDNAFTVTGWNDIEKYAIIANEVRAFDTKTGENLFDDPRSILTVWKHPQSGPKSVIAKGTYNQIKEATKSAEGSFTACFYIMAEDKGELGQDHLKLHGASFSAWADFKKKNQEVIYQYWIVVKEWLTKKNGNVVYKVPVFALGEKLNEKESEKADELSNNVDSFLTAYMARASKGGEPSNEAGQEAKPQENTKEIQKNWRNFKQEGKPVLGSLSIQELMKLQIDLEGVGDVDSMLYNCVSQAIFDYEQLLKTGAWKEPKNRDGKSFGELTLDELRAGLTVFNKKITESGKVHEYKLYIEAGIEAREAEQGPSEPVIDGNAQVVEDEDEVPF